MKGGNFSDSDDEDDGDNIWDEDLIDEKIISFLYDGTNGAYDGDTKAEEKASDIRSSFKLHLDVQDPPQKVDDFFKDICGQNEWGAKNNDKKKEYIADTITEAINILVNDSDHNANEDTGRIVLEFRNIDDIMEEIIEIQEEKNNTSDYEDDY